MNLQQKIIKNNIIKSKWVKWN